MNENDCNILVVLDKERNMTKAAGKLFISQPALTYRLRQIEKNFNIQIFEREKSGLIPTPEGELIVQYARDNLQQLASTLENVQLMGSEVQGTIKLGVASTYGQYILPDLLNRFLKIYPDVNFNIITGLSSMIFDIFKRGDVHIGIFRGDFLWEEQKELLAVEPICIVSKEPVQIDKLPDLPRIEYQMDSYLKIIIDSWWNDTYHKEGFVSMSVDSLETAKELVRTGLGYTILPGICLTGEEELYIEPIKRNGKEVVKRLTWLYSRSQTLDYLAVKKFYQFLKENNGLNPGDKIKNE